MKLVLQLVHLYKETDKTWTDVARLFSKIFSGEGSKCLAIRRKCVKEASTWQIDSESDIQTCLLRIVDKIIEFPPTKLMFSIGPISQW